jgi:hypothetical protein
VTTTHRRALLAQGRAAARRPLCLASVAPPRRQGGGSGPATRPLTAWAGSAELRTTSPPRTQVPDALRRGDRQASAGPGRTALGVSSGKGMRVARPRRGESGYSHWGRAPAGEGEGEW